MSRLEKSNNLNDDKYERRRVEEELILMFPSHFEMSTTIRNELILVHSIKIKDERE